MSIEGKNVIFVLGGPGSGKGTQAIAISNKYHFGYAAAGDLLREEAKKDTPRGKQISELISVGKIVPPELLVETLRSAIAASDCKYFLLDGFPRSLIQDDAFRAQVGVATCTLMLDVPDDVLVQRLTKRAESSGRADDAGSVIPKRIEGYKNETMPVLERYEKEGRLERVNGNQTIEKVEEAFVAVLRKYWQF